MANTLKFGSGQWATKVGSTLAYNDEGGNFKPLPFNFTRSTGATRVNKDGLIEMVTNNKPRIDFLNDSNGALLLEPNRTNLVTYSESFSGWDIGGTIAVTDNSTTSPDGTQNAAKIEYNGSAGYAYFRTTYTAAVGVFSIYAKKGNWRYLGIRNNGGSSHSVWDFDTETFSNVQTNHTMSFDALGNGWYRIMDYVSVDTAGPHRGVAITDATGTETSPSAPAGSYVYLWGAQGENSTTYATSYIPTQGATATRVADACYQTPPSGIIGQTEGTIFADFEIQTTGQDMVIMNISNLSTPSNGIYFYLTSPNQLAAYVDNGGQQVLITSGVLAQGKYKAAFGYKANDFAFYLNGNLVGVDNSGNVPTCSVFQLDNYTAVPTYQEKTEIAEAKLYNTRLSNSELQALTS